MGLTKKTSNATVEPLNDGDVSLAEPPPQKQGKPGKAGAKNAGAAGKKPPAPAKPKFYTSSLNPLGVPLPPSFAAALQDLESEIKRPLWLLIQSGSTPYDVLAEEVANAYIGAKASLPREPVALVIDSPGGYARDAYRVACLLRKHCGGFVALVPRYAKSAATLLTLGSQCTLLGADAELGPLDAQIRDTEKGETRSALDEVQVLERLHASALESLDQTMLFLLARMPKRPDTILPTVGHFVADLLRPIMEKVDTVQYTKMSRILKVAEEYATRLLVSPHCPEEKAKQIARTLVERYPTHDFVIDREEAARLDLPVREPSEKVQRIFERMRPDLLRGVTALGCLKEATK